MLEVSQLMPMAKQRSLASYVDLNSNFGEDGVSDLLFDRGAISQALRNIFSTTVGEAGPIFNPEFGSLLPQLLQEPLDDITTYKIRGATIQAVQRWEPRVEIDFSRTSVDILYALPGYQITLVYKIRQTGETAASSVTLKATG